MLISEYSEYYRSHPLVRKVIDFLPNLMASAWGKPISTKDRQLHLKVFERINPQLSELQKLYCQAQKVANLYGGAIIIREVEDGEDWINPININNIKNIKYSRIFNRYEHIQPAFDRELGLGYFADYYNPTYYRYYFSQGDGNKNNDKYYIHSSRVIRFRGLFLPRWELQNNGYWEDSLLIAFLERYKQYDKTLKSIIDIVNSSSIPVIKKPDLLTQIASSFKSFTDNLKTEVNRILENLGIKSGVIIDSEMDLSFVERSYANLDKVAELIINDLVASSGLTKPQLLGIHPTGLSATGESEKRSEAQIVQEHQESLWDDNIKYDLELLLAPYKVRDVVWQWNSSYEESPLEQIELQLKEVELEGKINELSIKKEQGNEFQSE